MGWKSTIDITRTEAKELIIKKILGIDQAGDLEIVRMVNSILYNMSNSKLADTLEELGYGDNPELIYYGRNFIVTK